MGCGHLRRHRSQVEEIEETQYDLNTVLVSHFSQLPSTRTRFPMSPPAHAWSTSML